LKIIIRTISIAILLSLGFPSFAQIFTKVDSILLGNASILGVNFDDGDSLGMTTTQSINLQGSAVTTDASIWLHQMQVEDALKLGQKQYNGRGCQKP